MYVSYCCGTTLEAAMGSLRDELACREADAHTQAEELRNRIDELKQQLAAVEERLTRLRITRETVDGVLAETVPVAAEAPERAGEGEAVGGPSLGRA
ncbi:hypothetical protein GPA10_38085 [Streptomyces sp. p1417]|uniref:Uncharacterized protein n=1 Tax=Streptomyces typhae TaxID=2681492 RepID=A0A6L6X9M2_9ACTN|nr:hypothetical protein [Streptomyces typhae]MVO90407.1 hypothetical protein [Streptomyces typhae]